MIIELDSVLPSWDRSHSLEDTSKRAKEASLGVAVVTGTQSSAAVIDTTVSTVTSPLVELSISRSTKVGEAAWAVWVAIGE